MLRIEFKDVQNCMMAKVAWWPKLHDGQSCMMVRALIWTSRCPSYVHSLIFTSVCWLTRFFGIRYFYLYALKVLIRSAMCWCLYSTMTAGAPVIPAWRLSGLSTSLISLSNLWFFIKYIVVWSHFRPDHP